MTTTTDLRAEAEKILIGNTVTENGRTYTIPTHGLYPHQWNWDSAICAAGWMHIDVERAWRELETLLASQDKDGMVPHIAFNPDAGTYQPGPEWWGNRVGGDGRKISCISQPPVAAITLRLLFDLTKDIKRATRLIEPLQRWHDWWLNTRDPEGRGEPVIVHPWETGRDNSVEWDDALDRAPVSTTEFERVDTGFVAAEQRPTKKHYATYIGLIEQFKTMGYEQRRMAQASGFRVNDPGVSSILAAACYDLGDVAAKCGNPGAAERAKAQSETIADALDDRRDSDGRVWTENLMNDQTIKRYTVGLGIQLIQPVLDDPVVTTLMADVLTGPVASRWGVASTSPEDPAFEPVNYWRGPVWASASWLVVQGMLRHGKTGEARELSNRILAAVTTGGFNEYHEPTTGEGIGGGAFSWTAAVTLDLLARFENE